MANSIKKKKRNKDVLMASVREIRTPLGQPSELIFKNDGDSNYYIEDRGWGRGRDGVNYTFPGKQFANPVDSWMPWAQIKTKGTEKDWKRYKKMLQQLNLLQKLKIKKVKDR